MNYKDIVRTAKAIFKEKHEPLLKKYFEGDIERKEEQITQWKFWYMNHFAEGAEWASEQFAKEKQQLIDKAVEYIKIHTLKTMSSRDIHNIIVDFENVMKGE